jgi:hypothetical protein
MNDLDEMQEDVLSAVRQSFGELVVPMCPSPEGIIAAARARGRRRRVSVAAAGLGTAALVAIVVPSLAPAGKPTPTTTAPLATAPPATAPPARLAGFYVATNADGTTTYTLSSGLLAEAPDALTATLAQHGIPAIVRQGSFCSSHPAPAGIAQIFVPAPSSDQDLAGDGKAVAIDPSAIPAGTALSIGLSSAGGSTAVHLALVKKNDYSCADMAPPGADSADQPANKPSNGADSNSTVRTVHGDTPGRKP